MLKDIPRVMKVAALFSGGKDSVFAVYIATQHGWDITHLVTIVPEQKDSWMFHSVNLHLTEKLASALGIPLMKRVTKGEKEKELADLKQILAKLEIDGVISGAVASEYQRTRIEKVCYDLGIRSFTPLWHKDQGLILQQQLRAGFIIVIVGVFAHGFDETWLGRIIDETCVRELIQLQDKYQINLAGEGGEFETVVLDGPLFTKKLVVDEAATEWRRDTGVLIVKKAHLE